MKHLRNFETEEVFESEKANLEKPCVALTKDDGFVHVIGNSEPTPTYEMVDLGLPSGTKWASCNLGATKPEEYGDYYQWGSTTPNTDTVCDWAHAPFNNGSSDFDGTYFNAHKSEWLDGYVLKSEYDAAYAATGGKAHMPTKTDFDELLANTTNAWTTVNGVNGRRFTASNGNSIFIPASGGRSGSYFNGQGFGCGVWSSSLNSDNPSGAWNLGFSSGDSDMYGGSRYNGFAVRPVSK